MNQFKEDIPREELMMRAKKIIQFKEAAQKELLERGYLYDRDFGCCGQGTLLALQEILGFEDELLFRSATYLAGGLGRTQQTCGALLGGVLMLGVIFGRSEPTLARTHLEEDREGAVVELVRWFEEKYGSCSCREITGFDFSNKEDFAKFFISKEHDDCFRRNGEVAAEVIEILYKKEKLTKPEGKAYVPPSE